MEVVQQAFLCYKEMLVRQIKHELGLHVSEVVVLTARNGCDKGF